MILGENACRNDTILSVGLKTMNLMAGRNHHIRPTEAYDREKFRSDRMRLIYSYIKFLKKVLNLELSSFWTKKELLKDQYVSILDSCDSDDSALVQILSQPEFRARLLQSRIDFQESNKRGVVTTRYCTEQGVWSGASRRTRQWGGRRVRWLRYHKWEWGRGLRRWRRQYQMLQFVLTPQDCSPKVVEINIISYMAFNSKPQMYPGPKAPQWFDRWLEISAFL